MIEIKFPHTSNSLDLRAKPNANGLAEVYPDKVLYTVPSLDGEGEITFCLTRHEIIAIYHAMELQFHNSKAKGKIR